MSILSFIGKDPIAVISEVSMALKNKGANSYHDCQEPQFASDMHYTSEFAVNMNKGSSVMPGTGARMHQSTHAKDRLIEHTMRTEFNDYVGSSVNPREAKGVIGDSNHKLNFKFPEGKNPRKEVPAQPRKAYPKGEHKGGH